MMDFVFLAFKGFEPGRLAESLIFLAVLMFRLKPHLKKADDRMGRIELSIEGINKTVSSGFAAGETRFASIENRLDKVEAYGKPVDQSKQTPTGGV